MLPDVVPSVMLPTFAVLAALYVRVRLRLPALTSVAHGVRLIAGKRPAPPRRSC